MLRINEFVFVKTTRKSQLVRFKADGRVTIPPKIRKQFQIKDGSKAIVEATSNGILLKPATGWAVERAFGILKRKPRDKSFAEEWAEHKREEMRLEDR